MMISLTLGMCVCVCVHGRLLALPAKKSQCHTTHESVQSINWSALHPLTTTVWEGGNKCEICGWRNVQDVYKGLYCFSRTQGQMDKHCFAGWCGSLVLVNYSPVLLSNLSRCKTVLRSDRQGQSYFLSLVSSSFSTASLVHCRERTLKAALTNIFL